MFPLPFNPYILITAVVVLAIAGGSGYLKGRLHGEERYANYRAAVESASAQADKANEAKIDEANTKTAEVARIYNGVAVGIRNDYRSRLDGLRDALANCQAVPAPAGTTGGADAPAGDSGSGATALATAQRLESDCAATAARMVWLQFWVREVCK